MKKNLSGLYKFIVFFLLISFVVTCSFILFLHFLDFDIKQLWAAAPVTFGNVIFITLIFWLLDSLRMKIFTERPIKRITRGLEKIANGEFSARIAFFPSISGMAQYNEIIEYVNKMAQELSGVETLRTDFVSNVGVCSGDRGLNEAAVIVGGEHPQAQQAGESADISAVADL